MMYCFTLLQLILLASPGEATGICEVGSQRCSGLNGDNVLLQRRLARRMVDTCGNMCRAGDVVATCQARVDWVRGNVNPYTLEHAISVVNTECAGQCFCPLTVAPPTQVPSTDVWSDPLSVTPADTCDKNCRLQNVDATCHSRVMWVTKNVAPYSLEHAIAVVNGDCVGQCSCVVAPLPAVPPAHNSTAAPGSTTTSAKTIRPTESVTVPTTTSTSTTAAIEAPTISSTSSQAPPPKQEAVDACDNNCNFGGVEATCQSRVNWVAQNVPPFTLANAISIVNKECVGQCFCEALLPTGAPVPTLVTPAPSPSPSPEGGLAPRPAPLALTSGCCEKCSAFCSPISGSCYASRAKPYYLSCNGNDITTYPALVWSDEFNTSTSGLVDGSKWNFRTGDNPSNQELQYYTDRIDNAHVEGGTLNIIGKCESFMGFHYTSARLTTQNKGDWGPGHRVEVKAKLPNGKGVWPAIWMLPTDSAYGGWPNSGEIDIMENVGCTRGRVYGTVHTQAYNHMKGTQRGGSYDEDETAWHTYSIEWEPTYIHFYTDSKHFFTFAPDSTNTSAWPFDRRFYLILNVAIGGSWGGFCLKGGPSCSNLDELGEPQMMQVDYVRVFSKATALTKTEHVIATV